jgi:hypothetical protein
MALRWRGDGAAANSRGGKMASHGAPVNTGGAANRMDLRAGLAPACAVYGTAASLPMLAENEAAVGARIARASTGSETVVPRLDGVEMAEG